MADVSNRRAVAGLVLVVVGVGLLGLQFVEGLGDSMWVLAIGAVFIAGYLGRQAYGLLIPGAILMGIGLGQVGEHAFGSIDGIGSIGLGVGFLAIYVIDRAYRGSTSWWPLVPGGILLVTGAASLGEPVSRVMDYAWPLLLVAAGLVLIFGVSLTRRRS